MKMQRDFFVDSLRLKGESVGIQITDISLFTEFRLCD